MSEPKRGTVWHVGRSGEVAGGMTQVVNGYLRWEFPRVDVRVIHSRDGSTGVRALWLFLKALLRVLFLGRPRRNLVVAHLSQGGAFVREGLLLRLARARGLRTIAHLHGSRFVDYAREQPVRVRRVLRSADRVIVLSDATRTVVRGFLPSDRIELVPNAVSSGAPREKERLVVFGGSVTRRKGVDVLLAAWRAVGAGSGWRLVVAGPHAEPDLVAQLPADCEAPGPLSNGALLDLLDRAAIAVLPSRDEAMPMFILEAMARRCCVVSTYVGGIPAVLGDGCGVLVDAGDEGQLKEALALVLGDDHFRQDTAETGWARFEQRFSAAAVYPRLESLWLATMKGQGLR